MLNTVVDLAGEGFSEIAAWLDNNSRPVETRAVVIGRLKSGIMVTLHGCGESVDACASVICLFTEKTTLHTGNWGERLSIKRNGWKRFRKVPVPPSPGV